MKKRRKIPKFSLKTLVNQIKTITLAQAKWAKEEVAKDALSGYIRLLKTSPHFFDKLFTQKGHLINIEDIIYWMTSVKVFGENFKFKIKIDIPLSVQIDH